MIYNSLFRKEDFDETKVYIKRDDGLTGYYHPYIYYMPYKGTLESVLMDLESIEEIGLGERDSRQKIIWGAPRIIRGVLDYKSSTNTPNSCYNAPELVLTATQAVINIYMDPLRIPKSVREVRDYLSSHYILKGILDTPIKQNGDDVTFDSTSPKYSDHTVDCLLNKFKGKNLLFLVSAHGGVPAGLDVFLRYQASSRDGDSIVYPVRYSTQKFEDKKPRLKETEIGYLRDVRKNRPVIIFDEDVASGTTMRGMKKFFGNGIFPEGSIFVRANDCGEDVMKEINGFDWKSRKESPAEEDAGDYTILKPMQPSRTAS